MGSLPRTPQMGVYAITHTPTGRQYIGASIDIGKRWQDHVRHLQRGDHHNRPLQLAWSASPRREWACQVVEHVTQRAGLATREMYWIATRAPAFGSAWRRPWRDLPYAFDRERFCTRVDKTADCWQWMACLSSGGYGKVSFRGASDYAHRVAWILSYGPIPAEACVLHRCDNRKCCRPEHLFLGSKSENASDRQRKGRHRNGTTPRERQWWVLHPDLVRRGEQCHAAKLTALQVRAIRAAAAAGTSAEALARRYCIGPTTARSIIARRTWAHID